MEENSTTGHRNRSRQTHPVSPNFSTDSVIKRNVAARSPKHFANGHVGPHRHPSASCFPKATEAANNSLTYSLGYISLILVTQLLIPPQRLHLPLNSPGGVRVVSGSGIDHQGPTRSGRDAGRNLGGSKGSSAKNPKAPCHSTPHSQRTRARFETLDKKAVKRKTRARFPAQLQTIF